MLCGHRDILASDGMVSDRVCVLMLLLTPVDRVHAVGPIAVEARLLNPPGGGGHSPLCFFCNNSETRRDSDAFQSLASKEYLAHICAKFQICARSGHSDVTKLDRLSNFPLKTVGGLVRSGQVRSDQHVLL